MDWKQFFADIIKSLAWPIVVVLVVFSLRGQLDRVIGTAEKVTYGDFEISFAQQVDQIRIAFEQSVPEVQHDQDKLKRLKNIASLSPSSAIMKSWEEVEVAAKQLVLRRNPEIKLEASTPYKQLETLLVEYSIANVKQIKIFHDLRVLRNKVAHAPHYEISSDQACEYVALALSLAEYFLSQ